MKTNKKKGPMVIPAADNNPRAATWAADEFRTIPRAELFPDPDQPRKTFPQAKLEELAESIREQGIVQPLIVRRVKAQFKIQEPDLTHNGYVLFKHNGDDWKCVDECDEKNFKKLHEAWAGNFGGVGTLADYQDRYVIVAGERRWRASEIAGLSELPCIVRDVDERRKFAQQIIENNQREGVSAIEEARAMAAEFERRKAIDPAFKKEDLAKELGMSRADFYGTLVLTRLHPPVASAVVAGTISASVAKEVAKLPTAAQQEKLLKQITNENDYQFPFSVRDVQELVEDYCKQLSEAPFSLKGVYINVGGEHNGSLEALSCAVCPHRTGNMVEEFPELKNRPNICTQPALVVEVGKAPGNRRGGPHGKGVQED
jgi:ParB/RepB/Spo0J family partition protein